MDRSEAPRTRDGRPGLWARSVALGLVLAASGSSGQDAPVASKARLASVPADSDTGHERVDGSAAHPEGDEVARAKRAIADCRARYAAVEDYTCTFFKRERIDGKLYGQHIMVLKARTRPSSLYLKFLQPTPGREAIYVEGKNRGKIIAHDVGIARVVAGTMHLDPRGGMAMEENRHPITEAGLGSLIETVRKRWDLELKPGESVVSFHPHAQVGDRPCTLIETIHPRRSPDFLFHKVRLYVDRELGLPIRFEAYDWPHRVGGEAELVEEYSYAGLKLNVGLKDRDFDPSNPQYAFGRF